MNRAIRISNLPLGFDSSMLEDMFTMVGNVQNAKVVCDNVTGESKGYGFVEMSTAEEAQDGILHFHGQLKQGHLLVVRQEGPHVPIEKKPASRLAQKRKSAPALGSKVQRRK